MYDCRGPDPRLKLILLPLIAFLSFFLQESYLLLGLLVFILVLIVRAGLWRRASKAVLIFLLLLLLIDHSIPLLGSPSLTLQVYLLIYLFQRLCLISLFGFYVSTTVPVGVMVESLQTMRCPRAVTIPFSVLLRFIPTMRPEMKALKENLLIRGVVRSKRTLWLHPLRCLEYLLVPLLMRALKVSDELAASAMVRGLDSPVQRTSLYDFRLKRGDYWIILLSLALIAGLLMLQAHI